MKNEITKIITQDCEHQQKITNIFVFTFLNPCKEPTGIFFKFYKFHNKFYLFNSEKVIL